MLLRLIILFFSRSFAGVYGMSPRIFRIVFSIFSLVFDVDISSLFIAGEPLHRV
jgi:hypothetical protein